MSSFVFIHLMNLNLIGPLLTPPTQCKIICCNRKRESESVDKVERGGRDRRKAGSERAGQTARRSQREPAWLAPGWLRGGVCVKSVLRGE